MSEEVIKLNGTISLRESLSANLSIHDSIVAKIGIPESVSGMPYEGDYTVTPTDKEITLATSGYTMIDNLTINPIPSNYGLITWDGSTLTVS